MLIVVKDINEKIKLAENLQMKILAVKGRKVLLSINAIKPDLIKGNKMRVAKSPINDKSYVG